MTGIQDLEDFTEQELALVYAGQHQIYKNAYLAYDNRHYDNRHYENRHYDNRHYDDRHYSEKYYEKGNDSRRYGDNSTACSSLLTLKKKGRLL